MLFLLLLLLLLLILNSNSATMKSFSCNHPWSVELLVAMCGCLRTSSIVIASVCICIVDAFDVDYGNKPKDMYLQTHQQQQQQQPFSFGNAERSISKQQDSDYYRYEINNNNKNENYRNSYNNDRRMKGEYELINGEQRDKFGFHGYNHNENKQNEFSEIEFPVELEPRTSYEIQNVRQDLKSRSSRSQPWKYRQRTTFQSLCRSKRQFIPLDSIEYTYRPDHYVEVTCYHSYVLNQEYLSETNKVCSEAGFTCIQLNRTITLIRRAKDSECWEAETRVVPSGCECMWPKHILGDINTYH